MGEKCSIWRFDNSRVAQQKSLALFDWVQPFSAQVSIYITVEVDISMMFELFSKRRVVKGGHERTCLAVRGPPPVRLETHASAVAARLATGFVLGIMHLSIIAHGALVGISLLSEIRSKKRKRKE